MKIVPPIACLVCANSGGAFLQAIEEELKAVADALAPLQSDNFLNIPKPLLNADSTGISNLFRDNPDTIQVFHFAGHADGEKIMLESGGGFAEGLSGMFGLQKNLALVFINGCNSEGQAQLFLDAGVKVVLATKARIKDTKAKEFATIFYKSLAKGHSIKKAYKHASSKLAADYKKFRAATDEDILFRGLLLKKNLNEGNDLPWRLFVHEHCKHHLDWRMTLETALMNQLRNGSKLFYQKLRSGRYRHVQIENLLLSEMQGLRVKDNQREVLFETKVIISRPDQASEEIPLSESLAELWKMPVPHLLLQGEGGSGKTVSILKLWHEFVETASIGTPIPVFIPMNEYNRLSHQNTTAQDDFLLNYIAENYLGTSLHSLTEELKATLIENLKKPLSKEPFIPSIILFLDGINEVTVDTDSFTRLWINLEKIAGAVPGVQVVMTSRYDSRNFEFAKNFHLVEIQPLEPERVEQYLVEKKVSVSEMSEEDKERLLRNPMMLTLLAASSELVELYKTKTEHFDFKPKVSSAGEILWNFMEAQLAKYYRDDDVQLAPFICSRLMLHHVLPYLGFEMERRGVFSLDEVSLDELLEAFMQSLESDDFWKTFRYYRPHLPVLGSELGIRIITRDSVKQVEKVKNYLLQRLQMLVEEGEFRFLHQHFRDFFAAVHLVNELKVGKSKSNYQPTAWVTRPIPVSVRSFIADLLGIYARRPFFDAKSQKFVLPELPQEDLFSLYLKKNRNIFDFKLTNFLIWNLIELLKIGKGELTGENLSSLNFERVSLNGIRCGRMGLPSTNFRGGRFARQNIFPQGINGGINLVQFNPSGSLYLIVGGRQGELRIWAYPENYCILALEGIETASFCSDNSVFICIDQELQLLDLKTMTQTKIQSFRTNRRQSLLFSNSGKHLAVMSQHYDDDDDDQDENLDLQPELLIWDPIKNSMLGEFTLSLDDVDYCSEFETDVNGEYLFLFKNSKIYCYSLLTSALIFEWTDPNDEIVCHLTSNSSLQLLAVGMDDGRIQLLGFDGVVKNTLICPGKVEMRVKERVIKHGISFLILSQRISHGMGMNPAFSKDNKFLYAGNWKADIYKWALDSMKLLNKISDPDKKKYIKCLDISMDGRAIISGFSFSANLWTPEGRCLHHIPPCGKETYGLDISPNHKLLALGCADCCVKVYSFEKKQFTMLFGGHTSSVRTVVFHPSKPLLYSSATDRTTKIWDLASGTCLLSKNTGLLKHIRFNPSGTFFACQVYFDDQIFIFDANSLELLDMIQLKQFTRVDTPDFADFINDEQLLIASTDSFQVYDLQKKKLRRKKLGSQEFGEGAMVNARAMVNAKAGLFLIGSGYDETFEVFKLELGSKLAMIPFLKTKSEEYNNIQKFSANGRFALLGQKFSLLCWDLVENKTYLSQDTHLDHILDLKIASDNSFATSTSEDNTIKLWSLPELECLATIPSEALLLVEGADFSNLHPESSLLPGDKEKMALYGAIV